MKFRVLTSSQRRRERVLDISLVIYYIGVLLKSDPDAYRLTIVGSIGLAWACMSWLMQKTKTDKLWIHIAAAALLLAWSYLTVVTFLP